MKNFPPVGARVKVYRDTGKELATVISHAHVGSSGSGPADTINIRFDDGTVRGIAVEILAQYPDYFEVL